VALAPGTRLGPYEVIAQIGAGGMGEVYRARDTKLNRDVALKILPNAFAIDGDRIARFRREAQVLASLNHPNIAHIYGFEDSGSTHALVLELVEGPTLADRIAKGPIPLDEALPIARQIAEALEAAHEQGIIHRDLKPANIKLRDDGTVKVLDFGLAKAMEPASAISPALTASPTITTPAQMTGVGMILGTAAYMSPEQAKGRPADKRSDVWAFGCVVYEMLAGQRAFPGDDLSETFAAVIKSEPDWAALPPEIPIAIRALIRQCLEKDAHRRVSGMAAARFVLTERAILAPAPTQAARASTLSYVVAVVSALAALAIGVTATVRELRRSSPPEMRVDLNTPSTPAPLDFALSPDGRYLAFVASGDGPKRLWLRSLDEVDARPLMGTDDASLPFWSPDSHVVAYFAASKLFTIDLSGSPPHALADAPVPRGGTWNVDGTILFSPNTGALRRVQASGGTVTAVTQLTAGHAFHRYPQFLPDGRHFLFYVNGSVDVVGLYLGSLDGGQPKRLAAIDGGGVLLPPDRIIFANQGALFERQLDIAHGELIGEPRVLAESAVPLTLGPGGGMGVSASAAGHVAYRAGSGARTELVWFDRTGKVLEHATEADANGMAYPDLSPDGRHVAVIRSIQNNQDIWLVDLVRRGLTRFTFDGATDTVPLWMPDGARILFTSNRKRAFDIYVGTANQPGNEQPLLEDSSPAKVPQDVSKDGRFLLYYEVTPGNGRDLFAVDLTSHDRRPVGVANTPFEETLARFSPDGRWVAYQTNATGRFEIVVQPFPGRGGHWQVSTAGGVAPRWRADGREIYFIAPDGSMMAAAVTIGGAAFDAEPPVKLFATKVVNGGSIAANAPQYAVSRDGHFLINQMLDGPPTPIVLILNVKR
jgi:serine/threonine protein kinase